MAKVKRFGVTTAVALAMWGRSTKGRSTAVVASNGLMAATTKVNSLTVNSKDKESTILQM